MPWFQSVNKEHRQLIKRIGLVVEIPSKSIPKDMQKAVNQEKRIPTLRHVRYQLRNTIRSPDLVIKIPIRVPETGEVSWVSDLSLWVALDKWKAQSKGWSSGQTGRLMDSGKPHSSLFAQHRQRQRERRGVAYGKMGLWNGIYGRALIIWT